MISVEKRIVDVLGEIHPYKHDGENPRLPKRKGDFWLWVAAGCSILLAVWMSMN